MSDDFTKRARYALHDMQGRVEAGKLAMFESSIDRIEALQAELAEARAHLAAARTIEHNVQKVREHEHKRAEASKSRLAEARKWLSHERDLCHAAGDRSGTIAYSRVLAFISPLRPD
jgi:peptide subunit release factor 1 (eRF1)